MRLIKSFGYALQGVKYCYSKEANFRIHSFFAVSAILAGIGLSISLLDWIIIISCIAFVAVLEMINTAIEKLCDKVYPGKDLQIKIIKDVSAGAVLLAAVATVIIGSIIFLPKILDILKQIK